MERFVGGVDEAVEAFGGVGAGGEKPDVARDAAGEAKRPGVELVVAVHKTVAILGLVGRVEDMRAIVDTESDATLAVLDEWFARPGGRRGQAQHRTHTSGLLWTRTSHTTSRAGDPAPQRSPAHRQPH